MDFCAIVNYSVILRILLHPLTSLLLGGAHHRIVKKPAVHSITKTGTLSLFFNYMYYFTDEDNCIIVETSEINIEYFLLVLEISKIMSTIPRFII